jgi:hypothetical protein
VGAPLFFDRIAAALAISFRSVELAGYKGKNLN